MTVVGTSNDASPASSCHTSLYPVLAALTPLFSVLGGTPFLLLATPFVPLHIEGSESTIIYQPGALISNTNC